MENFNRNVLNNAMSKLEVDYYFKNIRKYTKEKFRDIRNTMVTNFGLDGSYDLNAKKVSPAKTTKTTEQVLQEQREKLVKTLEKATISSPPVITALAEQRKEGLEKPIISVPSSVEDCITIDFGGEEAESTMVLSTEKSQEEIVSFF